MSSSVGEFIFIRQIPVVTPADHGQSSSQGILAVFARQSATLVIQVLVDVVDNHGNHNSNKCYQTSYNSQDALQSLRATPDVDELTALPILAELLNDSTKEDISNTENGSDGTLRFSCQTQHDPKGEGSTLRMRIQERRESDLVLIRWEALLHQLSNSSGTSSSNGTSCSSMLSFATSMVSVIHQLEEKCESMQVQINELEVDRDNCLDKINALSGKWDVEKTHLVQSFLELYNDRHENATIRVPQPGPDAQNGTGLVARGHQWEATTTTMNEAMPSEPREPVARRGTQSSRDDVHPRRRSGNGLQPQPDRGPKKPKTTKREMTDAEILSEESMEEDGDTQDGEIHGKDDTNENVENTSTSSGSATDQARPTANAPPAAANYDSGSETETDL